MSLMSRRNMIRQTAAGMMLPMIVPRSVLGGDGKPGANDTVGIGAIGVGNRARLLLEQLPASGRIVALSDCNLPRAEKFKADKKGNWAIYQDYRAMLERQDVDAVIVGTGEFQRVLPCIHACQAGKDVYAEKPLTLYVREGRVLVDAVRKYDRVLQVGTQQRSMAINRIACEFVRSGGLGKVLGVRAINYAAPELSPRTPFPAEPVPQGLDWDCWLNQAAMRPFNDQWMGWMRWRDFGGGQMTNWGAHGVDQIQWALGMDGTGPVDLWPIEGIAAGVGMQYANGVEVKFMLDQGPMGGAVFDCEQGRLEINRNKITSNPPDIALELLKQVDVGEEERKWSDELALWQARWHMQDWIDCIRSRDKPVADVETGHRSVTVCHLANICREMGERLKWDPGKEQFLGNGDANRLIDRGRREGFQLPS